MRTVSIIKDGSIVKSHIDYVITNSAWKLIEMSLLQYLESLKLINKRSLNMSNVVYVKDGDYDLLKYKGIYQFYLRHRYNNQSELTAIKDPWNRDFVLFPGIYNNWQIITSISKYDYILWESDYVDGQVCVLVTTVNGDRVYCVDVVKNTASLQPI